MITKVLMETLLNNHTLILTATNRLAKRYKLKYAQNYAKQAYPTPNIQALNNWCLNLFLQESKLHQNYNVLSTAQEDLLWYQLLLEQTGSRSYLQPHIMSRSMQQAWHNCQHYLLDPRVCNFKESTQTMLFQQISKAFHTWCQQHHYIAHSSIINILMQHLDQSIQLPTTIELVGLLQPTPQQSKFLQHLQSLGIACKHHQTTTPTTQLIKKVHYQDINQELTHIALFSKYCLESHPTANIGVIVPQLDQQRPLVKRIFQTVLAPSSLLQPLASAQVAVSISGGERLLEQPLIQTAMQLLDLLLDPKWPIAVISDILRSPFIRGANEQEMTARALLDAQLRRNNYYWVNVTTLHHQATTCPQLQIVLQTLKDKLLQQTANILRRKQSHQQWGTYFEAYLACWGWPGDRNLSSLEYQVVARWQQALNEWISCDWVSNCISLNQALQHLSTQLSNILFQAQQSTQAIQVLTPLEATGLNFDYLWIAQLDENTWPPAAQPSPWIPFDLQRSYQLPHYSTHWEYQQAKQQLEQFFHAAPHVIVSYSTQVGERNYKPSALIQDIPCATDNEYQYTSYQTLAQQLFHSQRLEHFVDEQAPATSQHEILQDGTQIIKDFSACAFKAFAYHRLHATNIETPQLKITAAAQGLSLHRALELIWSELKDYQHLCDCSEMALEALIQHSVSSAMSTAHISPALIGPLWYRLEQQRLCKLIADWLAFEKTRPPFKVLACEQWQQVNLNGLELHVQIDRMDQLCDGSVMILDYKTSKTRLEHWFGERMEEPQLPIYFCLYTKQPLTGLAYAQIRQDGLLFKGLATATASMPGIDEWQQWQDYVNTHSEPNAQHNICVSWKSSLDELSAAFQAGNAEVNPATPLSCRYCDLHNLCRIHEYETNYD